MVFTLDQRITERVQAIDYRTWRDRVAATGGCAQPVRLAGSSTICDAATGAVLHQYGGSVMVPCGNRREAVCPACSDRYAADAYHLIHAGLAGDAKGVPATVTDRPRVFATLTAPSFGAVHNRAITRTGKVRPCTGCGDHHHADDPRIGGAVDPDSYDYVAAVLWQAHAGQLWNRFTNRLRRLLAAAAGLRERDFSHVARLSYAKVAEYQRRGLVHFHAVIRIDGPTGPADPPPAWATTELLDACIREAARSVQVTTHRPDGTPLHLGWGTQVDVRQIRPAIAAQLVEDDTGEITDARLAAYIAKYATKGTGKSESADRPIRSQLHIDHLTMPDHLKRMVQTAWDLGGLDTYDGLNVHKWAHMLGFRGHFLTKSKHYSTTFTAIRGERRAYRVTQTLADLGVEPDTVLIVNDWTYTGTGHRSDAERTLALAIAERTRELRKARYQHEHQGEQ